jgi:lactate dehydrogenase-like 2-hydroxyacid dehydrogenase
MFHLILFPCFQVATGFHGVPDEILKQAHGYTAICVFVNKKISPEQVEILKDNGNKLILCCSAGKYISI